MSCGSSRSEQDGAAEYTPSPRVQTHPALRCAADQPTATSYKTFVQIALAVWSFSAVARKQRKYTLSSEATMYRDKCSDLAYRLGWRPGEIYELWFFLALMTEHEQRLPRPIAQSKAFDLVTAMIDKRDTQDRC